MNARDFEEALHRWRLEREAYFAERWNRSLPLGEMARDRWSRARALGFGDGASIYDSAVVLGDVEVDHDTWIGPWTLLDGTGGGLRIGATVSVSAGVQIYTHDSVRWALSGGRSELHRAPVTIGNHCYLGPMSIVTAGVTIGDRCLIGAGSVVNKDLPPNSIAWGATCRIVGRVDVSPAGEVTLHYGDQAVEQGDWDERD